VGQLPTPIHIGAVAIGATVFSFLFWGFGFLRMGTTGMTAQAVGAGDPRELAASFARPFLLGLVLSVPLIALQAPIGWFAFELFEGSAETERLGRLYFEIRIWSAPAALANYVCLGWLLGTGRTGRVLVLQLVLNGVNILLDLVFVLGFGWGVAGVAAATVIAQYVALGVGLRIVWHRTEGGYRDWRSLRLFDPARLRHLFRINFDIFVRTIALLVAFTYFTIKGTELGDVALAANAVLYSIFGLLAYGLDGFAWAAEALVGRSIGAGDRQRYRESVIDTTVWALVLALLVTLATVLFGPLFIDVMTVDETVRAASRDYLVWSALIPIFGVWCFMLDGIFIGATRTAEMRNGMVISLLFYLGAVWLLVPIWGNDGLWASLMVFFVARTATLGYWLPRIERAMIARQGE
jgi:MATE family multidrug resistance protein